MSYKKLAVAALAVIPILVIPVEVSAEETRPREEFRKEMNDARNEFKETRESAVEAKKDALQEKRAENVSAIAQKHADRLERRFDFYTKRLEAISNRLEKRLQQMEENGKDVAALQAKLVEAKSSINKASELGKEAVAAFRAVESGENKSQAIAAAKSKAEEARKLFKTSLESLKNIVKTVASN